MPTYVGLQEQGFYEPFKILSQGLQARADRKLKSRQVGVEEDASKRAQKELELRQTEFELQKPVMQETVRRAKNQQALDTMLSLNPPTKPFNDMSLDEQNEWHGKLRSGGYNGDLKSAIDAHNAAAENAIYPTNRQWQMNVMTGAGVPIQPPGMRGPGNASADVQGAPGSEQKPAATPGPNTPAFPTGASGATGSAGLPSVPTTPVVRPQNSLPQAPAFSRRPNPTFDAKGEMKIGMDLVPPSLTPEQQAYLRDHPNEWSGLPDYQRDMGQKYSGDIQKSEEGLRKRLSESNAFVAYAGHGTQTGFRHIEHLMDAAVKPAIDPKTGQIDWAKVDPVRSFSLVFSDAQANNPGAIVRPSDVENIEGLQGLGDKAFNFVASHLRGNKLSPALKQNLYSMVKDKIAGARELAMQEFENVGRSAADYGVPPHRLVGKPFLDEYEQYKKGATVGAPQVQRPGGTGGAPAGGPVKVNSQQEYDALPFGAQYVDSTGRTRTKTR